MRLPVNQNSAGLGRIALIAAMALPLAGCGVFGSKRELASAPAAGADGMYPAIAANGPQADYPLVTGEPYRVGSTTYTPEDVLNYDAVGYLAVDQAGGNGISGAHHTLPLPSYVEVTSLESGRTILVRLERRGPMDGNQLVALSPAALAQLGGSNGTPVRVRRVNPPEDQRALLRSGQPVPQRMDTPMSLVEVLKRRLPRGSGGATLAAATAMPVRAPAANPASVPAATALPAALRPPVQAAAPGLPPAAPAVAAPQLPALRPPVRVATPALPPVATPAPALPAYQRPAVTTAAAPRGIPPLPPLPGRGASATPLPARPVATPRPAVTQPVRQVAAPAPSAGGFVVQAGAWSTHYSAQQAARAVGGEVSRAGSLWRVRTGPFASRNAAEASLAKVKAAGYSEARIFTGG